MKDEGYGLRLIGLAGRARLLTAPPVAPAALTLPRGGLALERREAAHGRHRRRAVGGAADRADRLHQPAPPEEAGAAARWRTPSAAARASAITRWRQTCSATIQATT